MRDRATILHLDLDAFFASVEQRDKPSLRGKPVVVGGVGGRGVVSTASYEARRYGVHSAMPTRQARALCPHAAYLTGRFHAYRHASRLVMSVLREVSPAVEALSLDEAFVDLERGQATDLSLAGVTAIAEELKHRVTTVTGGLTASVGAASSKMVAKVASDLDKPGGLVVVAPGTERDFLRPMPVTVIPGVGPATAQRLHRVGVHLVVELERLSLDEAVRLLGRAHGTSLYHLARAADARPVESERETKSISVEGTYETDLTDRALMAGLLARQAGQVAARLRASGLSGRTVTVKLRRHDFSTLSRSLTLPSPTDEAAVIARVTRGLLGEVDTSDGVRLLGVGVSGLADWVQEDLFGEIGDVDDPGPEPAPDPDPGWRPGMDVVHDEWGPGWVWGSGRGVVTVRFETATTGPGPVRSFPIGDPALQRISPADE